jgi:ribosomal-protein-alanine N-acetyltransferase
VAVDLREYQPDDFEELWQLDQQCFAPGIAYTRSELMHFLRQPGSIALVANDGEPPICGFAIAENHTRRARFSGFPGAAAAAPPSGRAGKTGHVITIDVRERRRRSGVGKLLMDALEARLRQAGCAAVYLETAVDNAAAISFYKHRGYTILRTLPRYYHGELDALLMAKNL